MKPQCATAIRAAVGQNLTEAQLRQIEELLTKHLKMNARLDPARWASLSQADRLIEAGKTAAQEMLGNAAKKAQRDALKIDAASRLMDDYGRLRAQGKSGVRSIIRMAQNADLVIRGVLQENLGRLGEMFDAMAPGFLELTHDKGAMVNFVREVFEPGSTGDKRAESGAKAWLEFIESMRNRFNAAGGDIGKLDYGYIPQPHNQISVGEAGKDKWVADVLPLIKRERYVKEDGTQLDETELADFLGAAWETISSGGLNKLVPGQFKGAGMRANRGSLSREIHFRDADSYLAYMTTYGKGSAYDAMIGHITGVSRDIALVETLGPNPEQMWNLLSDQAKIDDNGAKTVLVAGLPVSADSVWKNLSGYTAQVANPTLAGIAQGARSFTVAAKLQGTLLSAVTDIPTVMLASKINKLPMWEVLRNTFSSASKEFREEANVMGLAAESVISDLKRFTDGHMTTGWTSKIASATMKLSGLEAWTNALTRGFQITMMNHLAKLGDWNSLSAFDKLRLENKGVTPEIYAIWKQATPEDWRGSKMLTPESIREIQGIDDRLKNEATAKLLGHITDEADIAVLKPDLLTRSVIAGGGQAGELGTEFRKTLLLFKSFPIGMISRHLQRLEEIGATNGKFGQAVYGAALIVPLTLFGALAIQLRDIASGKDPRDMTGDHGAKPLELARFWAQAFIQGGGMGIFGDILNVGMGGQNRGGQSNWASLAGPVFGSLFDVVDVTAGNLAQAIRGEKTNFGAEISRSVWTNLPFLRLWYIRSATEHMILNELQEYFNPGYLSRMVARSRQQYNQDYWWEPGAGTPERVPNIEAAFGR